MIKAKNQYELSIVVDGVSYVVYDIFKNKSDAESCAEVLQKGPNPLNPKRWCTAVVVDYSDDPKAKYPYGVFVGDGSVVEKRE